MGRGSNFITPVLFVAIGISLAFVFYHFLSGLSSDSLGRSKGDVSTAVATVPVSIAYAVGDYNAISAQSHICIGVKATSRSFVPKGVTVSVKSIISGATRYVATDLNTACSVVSDEVCAFCFDAPISPGEYTVEFRCTYCLPASGRLLVR